ncbi:hypothetical protein CEP51_007265 [Fusarium floridanum]|uniref:Uncharacterized protein n=1 Tax=Fusarium floridanum TaxID=1325733 RepID=A0A428RPS5_9HYPO|nr:hypothetical protein CEP51_007265 [Fusarium floridanum]
MSMPQREKAQKARSNIGIDPPHASPSKEEADTQVTAYILGSDGQGKDVTAIRRLTLRCQSLFDSYQKETHVPEDDWIDKMSAEFNWWSLGIGAAKSGHSSLDYRVKTRDDVRIVLLNLLGSLATSLEKYIRSVSQFYRSAQFTVAQTHDRGLKGAITPNSNPNAPGDDAVVEDQIYYIETTIRFLSEISMAIRKSGTKFRHQRVDSLLAARESELEGFGDYLRLLVLMSPRKVYSLHGVSLQHSLTGSPAWKNLWIIMKAYFTDTQRLTPVQTRLIQANLVRRNRFELYLARYRRRTRVQERLQLPQIQGAKVTVHPAKRDPSAPTPTPSQSHVSQTLSKTNEKAPIQPLSQQSSQSATNIGSFVMPQHPHEQKARSVSTKLSEGVFKQDYPKCPGAEGQSFWCPYCAQLLDASYSDPKKSKRWRGHVVEDLSPYVCVYENCDNADAMYVTTVEWKQHIKDAHSRARWICDPCWLGSDSHEEFEFDTQEEWHHHTLTEHGDEVDENDLSDLAELSQRTGVPPIACPLCYEGAALQHPETDKHLAEHIHSFALKSLPWDLIGPDDETRVSFGSSIRKSHTTGSAAYTTNSHTDDNDEVLGFEALVRTIKHRSGLLLQNHYPGTSSVATVLATIYTYLNGQSLRIINYHPSFRPEILACLARLDSIMQQFEDISSDFEEQSSVDTFEQDLSEAFNFFHQLEELSAFESMSPSSLQEIQSTGDIESPGALDGLGSNKPRDPQNWDIDSGDGITVDMPTVKRMLPYKRNTEFIARPELSDGLFHLLPSSSDEFQSAILWGEAGSGKHNPDDAVSLFTVVPMGPRGTVVWTRRNSGFGWPHATEVKVGSMTHLEAEMLFASTRGYSVNNQKIAELLSKLRHLPLAVAQAGAYMRQTSKSIFQYEGLLARVEPHPNPIALTTANSLYLIRQQHKLAYKTIHVFAYLNNRNISLDLVMELRRQEHYQDETQVQEAARTALADLASFRLISRAGDGFEMNQHVQEIVRDSQDSKNPSELDYLSTEEKPAEKTMFMMMAFQVVTRRFDLIHASRVCCWARDCGRETEAAALLSRMSGIFDDEERWREKETADKRALKLRLRVHELWHPDTASSYMSLAATHYQRSRLQKAEELVQKAVDLRRVIFGELGLPTMKCNVALGMIYHQQGRYHEARITYMRVLGPLGLDGLDKALALECLAWTYYMQGEYEEAALNFNASVGLHESLLGWQHPDTLKAFHQYAVSVHDDGHPSQAIGLMRKCVESRRTVLGYAHPLTNVSTLLLEKWEMEDCDSEDTE